MKMGSRFKKEEFAAGDMVYRKNSPSQFGILLERVNSCVQIWRVITSHGNIDEWAFYNITRIKDD